MTTPPTVIPDSSDIQLEPVKSPTPPAAPVIPHVEPVVLPDPPILPAEVQPAPAATEKEEVVKEQGDVDLLGSLEAQLDSAEKKETEEKEVVINNDDAMQVDKAEDLAKEA
jgi:hypothetical protein